MNRRFVIIMITLIVAFTGVIWFAKTQQKAKAPSDSSSQGSNHTAGKGSKGVTLTEFGDFECPACAQYYPLVEQLRQKFGDDITFQFRHFPLVQIHPNAMVGHRAAEAADKQGKFWEMYNLLYQQQQAWSKSSSASLVVEEFAKQIGLNIDQFKQDFNSTSVNDAINGDIKAGQTLGANSTPTFAINGKKVETPRDLESFNALIQSSIDAQKKQ